MGTSMKDLVFGIQQFRGIANEFLNWSYRVKLFLEAAGVSEVLTETAPEAAAEKAKFVEKDRKAKSLIVSCMADECLEVVREKVTAKEMWDSLEATYAKKSVASQTLIRKQLARLRMNDGTDMRSHLVEFDGLVRKLKCAGAKLAEGDLVSQLFLTLPDSYDPLVTALENVREEELTLDLVKQRLLAEESKRTDRQEDTADAKPAAFSGKSNSMFSGRSYNGGKRGYPKAERRLRDEELDDSEDEGSCSRAAVSFLTSTSKQVHVKPKKVVFKLDSGCSAHMVSDESVFSLSEKLAHPIEIDVAKEGVTVVAGTIGKINAISNEGVTVDINDVLLVKNLRANLLSVQKLTEAGVDVIFSGSVVVLQQNGEVFGTGHLKGALYELEFELATRSNLCAQTQKRWKQNSVWTTQNRRGAEPGPGTEISVKANRIDVGEQLGCGYTGERPDEQLKPRGRRRDRWMLDDFNRGVNIRLRGGVGIEQSQHPVTS